MSAVIDQIHSELDALRDSEKAEQQQRYMKSALPYYGVTMPDVRRVARKALREHPLSDQRDFEATLYTLWDQVTHREEWYAALVIAGAPKCQPFVGWHSIPMYKHFIVTGAWWDVVDDVATHLLGRLLLNEPDRVAELVRAWAKDENLWLQRTTIICQVGAKSDTNTDLLRDVIEPSLDRKEFFLRKAIGWALRDYSRTDQQWVREYVEGHRERLSGLSLREASKYL